METKRDHRGLFGIINEAWTLIITPYLAALAWLGNRALIAYSGWRARRDKIHLRARVLIQTIYDDEWFAPPFVR